MPQNKDRLHRAVRGSRVSRTTKIEGPALGEEAAGRLAARSMVRAESEDDLDDINAGEA